MGEDWPFSPLMDGSLWCWLGAMDEVPGATRATALCKLKQWTGEEPVWRLTQPWKSHCRRQDELFSSWSIDLDVNGWFFSTWEYWLNQLCSTFGVPRTFSSTGLVLLRAVVLQCSVNTLRSAAEWRMKDKQKKEVPEPPRPPSYLLWRNHEENTFDLSWPNETKDRAAAPLCLCSTDRDSAGWAGSQQLRELKTSVVTADRSNMDPVGPYWPLTPEHCDKLMFWAGRIKEKKLKLPTTTINKSNESK